MASSLLTIALLYFLLILFATRQVRSKYTVVLQFATSWTIIELAWGHAAFSAITLIMAIGDLNDWTFSTVVGFALTCYNIVLFLQLHQEGEESRAGMEQALKRDLGEEFTGKILPERKELIEPILKAHEMKWLRPFRFYSAEIECISGIRYGEEERNSLDLFRPLSPPSAPRPVMLQIHGGGWILGYGERQGLPLRNKLVEAGWIFVSINYRLSPQHKFPAHLVDCKRALHWIKENIAHYGGDPDFILVTGGSAGGHLASLVALTANQKPQLLQPGFESADTSVQGCIPVYGVYDFVDRHQLRSDIPVKDFLEDKVMPATLEQDPALWDLASPIAQVHEQRPPFLVLHGEFDTLSFVDDARYFVEELKKSGGSAPCAYVELPKTQHAFDIFYSPRCIHAIRVMHTFAEYLYSGYLAQKGAGETPAI